MIFLFGKEKRNKVILENLTTLFTLQRGSVNYVWKCTVGLAKRWSKKMKPLQQPKLKSFVHSKLSSSPITTITCCFFFLQISLSLLSLLSIYSNCANLVGCSYSKEALDVSAKLLEVNPECYTAWNYRKLAVQHLLSNSDSDPHSIFDDELKLVCSDSRRLI